MKFISDSRRKSYLHDGRAIFISIGLLIVLGACTELFSAYALSQILDLMPNVKAAYEALLVELVDYDYATILYVVILAPLLEELIFRVGIVWIGCKFMPFIMVNIMQALLFGIYHQNWVQGIYAFILGLLLGYVRYESDWIPASIILHMSINASGLMVDGTSLFSEGMPEKTLIMIVTVATGIGVFIVKYLVKMWNEDM